MWYQLIYIMCIALPFGLLMTRLCLGILTWVISISMNQHIIPHKYSSNTYTNIIWNWILEDNTAMSGNHVTTNYPIQTNFWLFIKYVEKKILFSITKAITLTCFLCKSFEINRWKKQTFIYKWMFLYYRKSNRLTHLP